MNVTREVVTDLLPMYFSGEASGDTKVLVEDYFRQDPDFERIARSAAKPLETLRAAAPVAADSAREKRDLESILWGMRRRNWLFAVSLFLTLAPVWEFATGGIRNSWHAVFDWCLAGVLWFVYFARVRWRTASLAIAIAFTVIPIPFVLHSVFAGGRVAEFAIIWIFAAFIWLGHFRQHPG